MLLLGERGTQKTTLLRKVAAHLGVVFYTCSADELTKPDAFGRDSLQILLRNLIAAADGNLKKAERAIISISGIERLFGPQVGGIEWTHKAASRDSYVAEFSKCH